MTFNLHRENTHTYYRLDAVRAIGRKIKSLDKKTKVAVGVGIGLMVVVVLLLLWTCFY